MYFAETNSRRSAADRRRKPIEKESKLVLLVDDEEVIREIGSEMLQYLGFRCLTASDGLEAVDLFEKHRSEIEAVILDVEMPGLSGDKVFHVLRQMDPALPIVICSGYSQDYLEHKVFRNKLTDYIPKPFHIQGLMYQLKKILKLEHV